MEYFMGIISGVLEIVLGHGVTGVLTVMSVAQGLLIFWLIKRYVGLIERSIASSTRVATMLEGMRSGGHGP